MSLSAVGGSATKRDLPEKLTGQALANGEPLVLERSDVERGFAQADVVHPSGPGLAVPDARLMADDGYKVILAANLVKLAALHLLSL